MNVVEGTRQISPVTLEVGCHTVKSVVALKREWRLFIKNTGLCKIEKCCIEFDACQES